MIDISIINILKPIATDGVVDTIKHRWRPLIKYHKYYRKKNQFIHLQT